MLPYRLRVDTDHGMSEGSQLYKVPSTRFKKKLIFFIILEIYRVQDFNLPISSETDSPFLV